MHARSSIFWMFEVIAFVGIVLMVCTLARGQALSSRYAHQSVLRNAELEAMLPSRFLNPFYQDFQIRRALARSSWFGPKEQAVYRRATDSITRKEIFTVLNHAGLLPQQQQQQQQRLQQGN